MRTIARPVPNGTVLDCAWCGDYTVEATGAYLSQVAHGRRLCAACGRFTLHCECPKAGAPLPVVGPVAAALVPVLTAPRLVE